MLNHIAIQGRLTANPELRNTQNGVAVATFTVAVDRDYQKEAVDFFSVTAWRQTAEFVSKYFQKGQMVVVSGKMHSRKWEDRDSNKRTAWEIQAADVYFCERREKAPDVRVEEIEDDEEMPF